MIGETLSARSGCASDLPWSTRLFIFTFDQTETKLPNLFEFCKRQRECKSAFCRSGEVRGSLFGLHQGRPLLSFLMYSFGVMAFLSSRRSSHLTTISPQQVMHMCWPFHLLFCDFAKQAPKRIAWVEGPRLLEQQLQLDMCVPCFVKLSFSPLFRRDKANVLGCFSWMCIHQTYPLCIAPIFGSETRYKCKCHRQINPCVAFSNSYHTTPSKQLQKCRRLNWVMA